jgi:hypothetical protein
MITRVQGVVPGRNVQMLIATGDIPRTGVEDAVLYNAFVIPSKLEFQGVSLGLESRISVRQFASPLRRTEGLTSNAIGYQVLTWSAMGKDTKSAALLIAKLKTPPAKAAIRSPFRWRSQSKGYLGATKLGQGIVIPPLVGRSQLWIT